MKLITLLLVPALTTAFVPSHPRTAFAPALFNAKAAASKEEDLELTRKVIQGFTDGGAPAVEEPAEEEKEEEKSEE